MEVYKEFKCAQDVREEELLEQGYVKADKVFYRIGRTIFVVDTLEKDFSEEEALETPIGTVAKLNNPGIEFNNKGLKMLQELFGSTGFLRIAVEGDEDCGFAGTSEVLLTGYRAGLDDVIVDGKLLVTTHNSQEDIMRNFADHLEWMKWRAKIPDWKTYEGMGYRMKESPELKKQIVDVVEEIRSLANTLEHKDDMPDWVREKFTEVE